MKDVYAPEDPPDTYWEEVEEVKDENDSDITRFEREMENQMDEVLNSM